MTIRNIAVCTVIQTGFQKAIDRDDENQAEKYRDDLITKFQRIEILMIGKGRASSVDPRSTPPDLTVVSYAQLISTARAQLDWLLQQQLSDLVCLR